MEEHITDSCENKDKKAKHLGCPYCSIVFHHHAMRNAHMLSHQDKGLVCTFCENEDVWEHWKLLRKHYQQKHGSKMKVSLNPMKKDAEKLSDAGKQPALKDVKSTLKVKILVREYLLKQPLLLLGHTNKIKIALRMVVEPIV